MPKDLYAVMTGDLVNYSKVGEKERLEYIQNLKDILEKLRSNDRFFYETYRGDSFQAVYQTPRDALRLVLLIRSYVISQCLKARKKSSHDVRIALGIGTINSIDNNAISHSDGEAFRNSGPLLDGMNKKRRDFLIKTPWPDVNKELDTECALLDTIIRKWTADQAEAMYYHLQNHSQKEIAKILKIHQGPVSLRLNGANYWAVQKFINRFVELIDKNVIIEYLISSNLELEDDAEEDLKNTLSSLEEKLKQYPESVDF